MATLVEPLLTTVIPSEAGRLFSSRFAPANRSACAVEESLFDFGHFSDFSLLATRHSPLTTSSTERNSPLMKAMILAAGLGTRLRPLTDSRPKALVELSGRTLLEITITRLRSQGVTELILNVHHFADQVLDYLHSKNNFGLRIEVSREDVLLDTGGGLKQASWFFLEDPRRLDEPFLLHNVDVVSTIDLAQMLQSHKESQALATLAVQQRDSSRQLLFDAHSQLSGRRIRHKSGEDSLELVHPVDESPASPQKSAVIPSVARNLLSSEGEDASTVHASGSPLSTRHSFTPTGSGPLLHPLAFSGIHVLSPRLLPFIHQSGIFSIIDTYLHLAAQNQKILAFRADQFYWRDLGRPSDLAQAASDLQQNLFS
jgi:NDP-sugar pyrophosphorylase family protein